MRHRSLIAFCVLGASIGCSRQDAMVDEYRAFSTDFTNRISRIGLMKESADIEAFVKSGDGTTQRQKLDAFCEVFTGCPDCPRQRQKDIAAYAAKMAMMFSRDDHLAFCRTCGMVARLDQNMPPDDCVDSGIFVFHELCKHSGRPPTDSFFRGLRLLVEKKKYKANEAIAMGVLFAKSAENIDDFEAVAKKIVSGELEGP